MYLMIYSRTMYMLKEFLKIKSEENLFRESFSLV